MALLIQRGFEVSLSGLALAEIAVYFGTGATEKQAEKRTPLRKRLHALAGLLPNLPVSPTHGPLVSKLGGRMKASFPGRQVPYSDWLSSYQTCWRAMASDAPLDGTVSAFIDSVSEYVQESGDDFVDTMTAAASLGPHLDEDGPLADAIWEALPSIVDQFDIPGSVTTRERFDAYERIQRQHADLAFLRSIGQATRATPNHATDINMLQHLADGSILATGDVELLALVDASGSRQAPWVRTIPELLLGRVPRGLPFGLSARKARKKHRPRTRAALVAADREAATLRPPRLE